MGRSHGHHRAVLVTVSGQVSCPPLGSSDCPLTRLAEAQARFPSVPIVFCETRPLAQEWLYRWFGACLHEHTLTSATSGVDPVG